MVADDDPPGVTVLYRDESIIVLDKPANMRHVPGNYDDASFGATSVMEWHLGTKLQRQEFWTEVLRSAGGSGGNGGGDNGTRTSSGDCSGDGDGGGGGGGGGNCGGNSGNSGAAAADAPPPHLLPYLRRIAELGSVPRKRRKFLNFVAVSLKLDGERAPVAEQLWDVVAARLRAAVGPDCDSLLTRVRALYPTAQPVHRLDVGTSGVAVMPLTDTATSELSRQFRERVPQKRYVALLEGELLPGVAVADAAGEVTAKLRPDLTNRPFQLLDESGAGKEAHTTWRVLERLPVGGYSLGGGGTAAAVAGGTASDGGEPVGVAVSGAAGDGHGGSNGNSNGTGDGGGRSRSGGDGGGINGEAVASGRASSGKNGCETSDGAEVIDEVLRTQHAPTNGDGATASAEGGSGRRKAASGEEWVCGFGGRKREDTAAESAGGSVCDHESGVGTAPGIFGARLSGGACCVTDEGGGTSAGAAPDAGGCNSSGDGSSCVDQSGDSDGPAAPSGSGPAGSASAPAAAAAGGGPGRSKGRRMPAAAAAVDCSGDGGGLGSSCCPPLRLTRVQFRPTTGRTHQLRLHSLWLGHPIVGDTLYGSAWGRAASDRLLLHAEALSFQHPVTGETVEFSSPCPF